MNGALIIQIIGASIIAAACLSLILGAGTDEKGTDEKPALLVLGTLMIVVGTIFSLVWGIMWGSTYLSSTIRVAELQAFQNTTYDSYIETILKTEAVVIDDTRTRGGSVTDFSYQQQGQAVSERMLELRNLVHEYNRELATLNRKNALPVIGSFYAPVPDSLQPITIQGLVNRDN